MIRFLALISAILIIALPAVAEETDKSPTVTNINVEEKEGITEIQIEANSPFEYAVYTPLNPYRIAVELKDINLGRFTKKIVVGKAGVMEIAPADTGDSRDFVRLDIILAEPGEVKSFREGNVLILSVSKMEVKKQEHRAQSTEHREVEVRKQEVLTEVKKDLEVSASADSPRGEKEQGKPAAAEVQKTPAIADINVKEKAGITEILIESNSPFTYTMYKPSDPHKVVVELNNINLGKFTDKIVVGRDGIMEIVPTKIDDPQSLARLDITLTAPAEVKPSLKGNSLILYVLNSSPEVKNVKKEEEKPAVAKISEPQKEEDSSGATTVMVRTNFGGYLSKKVVSVREMRFKDIVPQQYDFSCGAASMATIFKYLYGVEGVKEEEIVKDMIAKGDQDLIKEKGFSLLDMKKYAERHGFQANGYKVKAENLSKLRIPTIVLMNTRGYTHFVVLKGVKDGRAYLADPAAGNRAVPLEEFMESWDSVVFVVYKKTDRDLTLTLNTAMRPPVSNVLRLTELGIRNYIPLPGEF